MDGDGRHAATASPNRTEFAKEAELARFILRQRRKREAIIGAERFSDPAWDMMLDLFSAGVAGEQVATSSLFVAANVPQSTALRWIKNLTEDGSFVSSLDPHDGRRTFIALSDDLFDRVGRFLKQLSATVEPQPSD